MSTDDAISTTQLGDDAFAHDDDDWDVVPPPRRTPWLTRLLAVGAVALAAFAGGILAQKQWGKGTTSSATGSSAFASARAARLAGGAPPTSTPGGATNAGANPSDFASRGTFGQVTYIKGTTLYVTTNDGNVVQVKTGKASTVTKTVKTTVNGINPGDSVVVQGTTGSDGSVTATSVTIGGLGGGLFGAGG